MALDFKSVVFNRNILAYRKKTIFSIIFETTPLYPTLDYIKGSYVQFFLFVLNMFNPFLIHLPILYLLKTAENLWFSAVFRGYKMGTFARNGLCSDLFHAVLHTRKFRKYIFALLHYIREKPSKYGVFFRSVFPRILI